MEMPVPEKVKERFNLVCKSAEDGKLAIVECIDTETKEMAYVACHVDQDGGEYTMFPMMLMLDEDTAMDRFVPPGHTLGDRVSDFIGDEHPPLEAGEQDDEHAGDQHVEEPS
jgi:hypothetical protein